MFNYIENLNECVNVFKLNFFHLKNRSIYFFKKLHYIFVVSTYKLQLLTWTCYCFTNINCNISKLRIILNLGRRKL